MSKNLRDVTLDAIRFTLRASNTKSVDLDHAARVFTAAVNGDYRYGSFHTAVRELAKEGRITIHKPSPRFHTWTVSLPASGFNQTTTA